MMSLHDGFEIEDIFRLRSAALNMTSV